MKDPTNPRAAVVPHHAHMLGLNKALDGVPDIAGSSARLDQRNTTHHRLVRHCNKFLGAGGDFPYGKHPGRPGVPAVNYKCRTDAEDITLTKLFWAGYAMAHYVVYRNAGGTRVTAVIQQCW